MPTVPRQSLIIPYGTSHWTDTSFTVAEQTETSTTYTSRTYTVVIDPAAAKPFRFNSGQYAFPSPPELRLLPTVWDRSQFLQDYCLGLCETWAKYQHLFIARYFDFIRLRIEEARDELTDKISSFGDLYEYRDWVFSALRPLPRAYIFAPKNLDQDVPPSANDFVMIDFVFWDGQNMIAINLTGSEKPDPFHQKRLDRLNQNGVKIISIEHAILEDENDYAFRQSLPPTLVNFWQGEIAPASPFVDTKLGDIAASDIGF